MLRTCEQCHKQNRVPARHLSDAGKCGACKAPLQPLGEPVDADATLFDEVVRAAKVPVLVDFWASWCGPCRAAAPEVAKAAREMAGRAIVLKVNTEKHPELAARYGVRGIPHFVVLRGGKLVHEQAGLTRHGTLKAWLESAAGA